MTRFASLAVVSVASIGMTLATPEVSQAQFGLHLDVGRTHVEFGRSYGHGYGRGYSDYYGSRYNSYSRYGRDGHHHDHHYGRRSPVVIPEYYHWTPDRGHHSHGQILVPHRGHYHVRPY